MFRLSQSIRIYEESKRLRISRGVTLAKAENALAVYQDNQPLSNLRHVVLALLSVLGAAV